MVPRKKIVLATLAFTSLVLGGLSLSNRWSEPKTVRFEALGFPSLGNPQSKIRLVLFEDLRCAGCQFFDQVIYPKIAADYIETGKVLYTAIPVAFLSESKIRGNAAWAVYIQNPEKFFPYVHQLYSLADSTEINQNTLLYLAQKVGGIDLDLLGEAIESDRYYDVLDKNTEWAKKIMGKEFATPALYVNGVRVSTRSFEGIELQLKNFLK